MRADVLVRTAFAGKCEERRAKNEARTKRLSPGGRAFVARDFSPWKAPHPTNHGNVMNRRALARLSALALLFSFALFLSGCAGPAPPAPPNALRETVERGPLRLTASVSPAEPLIGDRITLTLELRAPADYEVNFPEASALEGISATADSPVAQQSTEIDESIWRQSYQFYAEASGVLPIPELSVGYRVPRTASQPATEASSAELLSPPIEVPVRSVLTSQESPDNPRTITGVRAPPPRPLTAWEWTLIVLSAAAALLAAFGLARWVVAWRNRPRPPVAPDVAALAALDELAHRPRQTADEVRAYYYAMSEIVRRYIEQAFGVAAPEMTTEEFLRSVAERAIQSRRGGIGMAPVYGTRGHGGPLRSAEVSGLLIAAADLQPFLEQCDLVKYAALDPLPADAERALAEARSFVRRTGEAKRIATAENARRAAPTPTGVAA